MELEKYFGNLSAVFKGAHREVTLLDALVGVDKLAYLQNMSLEYCWTRQQFHPRMRGYTSDGHKSGTHPAQLIDNRGELPEDATLYTLLGDWVTKFARACVALKLDKSPMLRSFAANHDVVQVLLDFEPVLVSSRGDGAESSASTDTESDSDIPLAALAKPKAKPKSKAQSKPKGKGKAKAKAKTSKQEQAEAFNWA